MAQEIAAIEKGKRVQFQSITYCIVLIRKQKTQKEKKKNTVKEIKIPIFL